MLLAGWLDEAPPGDEPALRRASLERRRGAPFPLRDCLILAAAVPSLDFARCKADSSERDDPTRCLEQRDRAQADAAGRAV